MFFFNLFRPPPPSKSFVKYKASKTFYDSKTRSWQKSSRKKPNATMDMINERGGLKALAQAKPGDRLIITKEHIYKERQGKWTLIQKPHEKGMGAAIRRFLGTLPLPKRPQNREKGIEVRVVRRKTPRTQKIIKQIQKINPGLADQIKAKQQALKPLLQENQRLEQTERVARVKLSGLIEKKTEELKKLCTEAKTAVGAQPIIKQPLSSEVKLIGKGAVKEVFIKKGEKNRLNQSVYYVAKQGLVERITGRGSAEIKEEVSIAKKIKNNLLRKQVYTLLQKNFSKTNASILTHLLIERFPSVEALETALQIYEKEELASEIGIQEVDSAQRMSLLLNKNIQTLKGLSKNLAIDLEEVVSEERVEGRVTVRAAQAESDDLEKRIRRSTVTMKERLGYVQGAFDGLKQLHDAGHVHGDIKPENMLIFSETNETTGKPEEVVKLADLGKVREHAPKEISIYRGNPRFACPEKKLSMQGEVYAAAMVAIRVLEEGVLAPKSKTKMLLDLKDKDIDDIEPKKGRRGIEKYVVLNKRMTQTESTLKGRVKELVPQVPFLSPDLNAAQDAMHSYINRLVRKLIATKKMDVKPAAQLGALLKEMTLSIPESRPSMAQVAKRYNKLTSPLVK